MLIPVSMNAPIPVIFATDRGYIMPTAVCITSLKQYRHRDTRYEVHLLCWDISAQEEQRLMSLADEAVSIHLHAADPTRYTSCTKGRHMPPSTFLRLDCACLLPPSITRALYLDGDTIIKDDLSELYATPMQGCTLAAVPDLCLEEYNRNTGVTESAYINAGILLMDLQRMRKHQDATALREAADHMPAAWQYMDQDLLNHYYRGKIFILPPRYNCMLPLFDEDKIAFSLPRINQFYHTRYTSLEDFYDDAAIIHYAGRLKPWMHETTPWGTLWRLTYGRSPYATCCLRFIPFCKIQRILLLGILPLFKRQFDSQGHKTWLFDVIPLWSYHNNDRCGTLRLFHCLPLFSIRKRVRR